MCLLLACPYCKVKQAYLNCCFQHLFTWSDRDDLGKHILLCSWGHLRTYLWSIPAWGSFWHDQLWLHKRQSRPRKLCFLTGDGHSTWNFLFYFLNKTCFFLPEMLCTQDKISGWSWGRETGADVDQLIFFFVGKIVNHLHSSADPKYNTPLLFLLLSPYSSQWGWAISVFCHYTNIPCFYRDSQKIKRDQQKLQIHTSLEVHSNLM